MERRAVPQDRRAHALHLTPRGEATLADVGRVAREHGDALLAALDERERRLLRDLLARVAGDQGLTPGVHPGFRTRG